MGTLTGAGHPHQGHAWGTGDMHLGHVGDPASAPGPGTHTRDTHQGRAPTAGTCTGDTHWCPALETHTGDGHPHPAPTPGNPTCCRHPLWDQAHQSHIQPPPHRVQGQDPHPHQGPAPGTPTNAGDTAPTPGTCTQRRTRQWHPQVAQPWGTGPQVCQRGEHACAHAHVWGGVSPWGAAPRVDQPGWGGTLSPLGHVVPAAPWGN